MSQPHMHLGGPHMTQNQGNVLGDRPCVRQSRLYREQVGGNAMKDIMGQTSLKWDTNRTQGAYEGGRVYDHNSQRYEHEPTVLGSGRAAPQGPAGNGYAMAPQGGQDQWQQAPSQVTYGAPSVQQQPSAVPQQQQQDAGGAHRRGAGAANRTTYNFMTGQ
mmetsp:Transcript_75368/g.87586  ORF Transcript_75368/g.87586 Transcript_75368/m.87586 type:complete len:160 (+) Transcript_75368:46-525(+)